MIQSLKIKNYKNISGLSIPYISHVNLISGKNNVGKSSVLEALSLLISDSSMIPIFHERGELDSSFFSETSRAEVLKQNIHIVSSLFTGRTNVLGKENAVELEGDTARLRLELVHYVEQRTERQGYVMKSVKVLSPEDEIVPDVRIALNMRRGDKENLLSLEHPIYQERYIIRQSVEENDKLIRLGANSNDELDNATLWDTITLTDKEEYVMHALRIIEPNIESLAFLQSRNNKRYPVVKLRDNADRIPLRSMGDGINHILSIILSMVNCENGYLLIDEIDNGLHNTVQTHLWDVIFNLSEMLNVQVFATTHSSDCICSFGKVLKEENNADKGRYLRLEKKIKGLQVVEYDAEELSIVAAQNIEIR